MAIYILWRINALNAILKRRLCEYICLESIAYAMYGIYGTFYILQLHI